MRIMERNKSTFYYAMYLGSEPVLDEHGNEVGAKKNYTIPIRVRANISTASGAAQAEQFGANLQYDKVIATDDMHLPINEDSILWLDKVPFSSEDPYNYIVKRIARSLNSVSYAITKVDVS